MTEKTSTRKGLKKGLKPEHELHNLANDYYKKRKFDKAVEYYSKALAIRPNQVKSYFNRGLAYAQKGVYDEAIKNMNKVIKLKTNLVEAYYARGLFYEYKRDYRRAIKEYSQALKLNPKYTKAKSQTEIAKRKLEIIKPGKIGNRRSTLKRS